MSVRVRMAENGAQLLSRLEERPSLRDIESNLFPEDCGPAQGDVVELHGVEGVAKTETLYHLLARCLVPARCGGLEVGVVFIDTDLHFDMLRLVSVLEGRVGAEPEEGVRSCLRRLCVVTCSGSHQLRMTLLHLQTTFARDPALRLLVIDSVSAFSSASQECRLLDTLLRLHGLVLFATSQAAGRRRGPGGGAELDTPFLCHAWQKMVTHRLVLARSHAPDAAGQLFCVTCTHLRSRAVKRSSFHVLDHGIRFLK